MNILEYSMCEGVRAFSTKRTGGVGQGAYSTFSITPYTGDEPQHVKSNIGLLCATLNISEDQLVLPWQTHTANVKLITAEGCNKFEDLKDVDALITQQRGVCIGVSTADCVPVLLCDKTKKCVAAIHAGWRGTVANIVGKTIEAMCSNCNVCAKDIVAVIGPSISLESFEVGDEVYEAFRIVGFDMKQITQRYCGLHGERWHIDLWAAVKSQLQHCGVLPQHIQVSGICTYQHYEEYFSARRLGLHSGRIFSGIMLE